MTSPKSPGKNRGKACGNLAAIKVNILCISKLPVVRVFRTSEAKHATNGLKFFGSCTIIRSTYPPRLSGFDREAQPWWVFYAPKAVSHHAI